MPKNNNKNQPAGAQQPAKPKKPGQKKQRPAAQQGGAPLSRASRQRTQTRPREELSKDGSRTLYFEEYVQDIAGSVAFSATSFPVQPGVATLFAWLADQAGSYQEYAFRTLGFRFESELAADKTGKVMLTFLPDAADPTPTSKQEMLESPDKAKCKVWEDTELRVNTADAMGRRRFVRSGVLAANLDIKTYDVGQLIVATQGCADTALIGELYVTYSITLFTPVTSALVKAKALSAKITAVSPSSVSIFGTTPTVDGALNVTATVNTITFNRVGYYVLTTIAIGTGLFTSYVPVTSASTATVTRYFGISNAAANVGTTATTAHYVNVTARGQTVVLDCTTQATTITSGSTLVTSGFVA